MLAANIAGNAPIHATPSQQSPPAKSQTVGIEKREHDTKELENAPKAAPLVVEAHVSGKLQTTSDQASQKIESEYNRWFDPISIFTLLLVIVGSVQAWFLYQTNKGTQKAAEAAKESADAVVGQLRAYISMKTTEGLPPRFDPITGPWCAFDIRNTGQTPAFNLVHSIRAAIGTPNHPGPFEMEPFDSSSITLAPGAVVNISTSGPIPLPGDVEKFARRELVAYIYGEIEYTDAFGNKRFHKYRYTFAAPDLRTGVAALTMTKSGNEAN